MGTGFLFWCTCISSLLDHLHKCPKMKLASTQIGAPPRASASWLCAFCEPDVRETNVSSPHCGSTVARLQGPLHLCSVNGKQVALI